MGQLVRRRLSQSPENSNEGNEGTSSIPPCRPFLAIQCSIALTFCVLHVRRRVLDDVIDVLLLAHHALGSNPRETRPRGLRGPAGLEGLVLFQLLLALLHFGHLGVARCQQLVEGVNLDA